MKLEFQLQQAGCSWLQPAVTHSGVIPNDAGGAGRGAVSSGRLSGGAGPVSYTHLTLPTIYSV